MQCFFDFARLPDIYCFCCSIHPAFPYNCLYLIFWETTSTKSLKDTISVKILVRKLNNFPNSYCNFFFKILNLTKKKHSGPVQKCAKEDFVYSCVQCIGGRGAHFQTDLLYFTRSPITYQLDLCSCLSYSISGIYFPPFPSFP